jgi:hypothetical protein
MQTCCECGRQSPLNGPLEHFYGCSMHQRVHYGPGAPIPTRPRFKTEWSDHTATLPPPPEADNV